MDIVLIHSSHFLDGKLPSMMLYFLFMFDYVVRVDTSLGDIVLFLYYGQKIDV